MSPSVLVYVQHLLGIGHLARASMIAGAMLKAGWQVKLATGGPPVAGFPGDGIETLALPPLRAGPDGFSQLVDLAGRPVGEDWLARRRDQLLAAFESFRPDVLLIEAYPFGRRQMRFELQALLERARTIDCAPVVACSVRDIVQENRKPERDRETVEVLNRWFNLVLVHGDPALIRFDASFPLANEIAPMVRYTGLVTGEVGALDGPPFDVVVSAGGGAAGGSLMRAAIRAFPRSKLKDACWGFVTGPNLPPEITRELKAGLPANAAMAPHRHDFRALLAKAQLSISQAGYNTAADVLVSGCRSIMVPFAEAGETEQSRRAAALESRGLVQVVKECALTPEMLAEAIDRAMERGATGQCDLDLNGAQRTEALLLDAVRARRH